MNFYYTIKHDGKDYLGNYSDKAVAQYSAKSMSENYPGIFTVYFHKDDQTIDLISFQNGKRVL